MAREREDGLLQGLDDHRRAAAGELAAVDQQQDGGVVAHDARLHERPAGVVAAERRGADEVAQEPRVPVVVAGQRRDADERLQRQRVDLGPGLGGVVSEPRELVGERPVPGLPRGELGIQQRRA